VVAGCALLTWDTFRGGHAAAQVHEFPCLGQLPAQDLEQTGEIEVVDLSGSNGTEQLTLEWAVAGDGSAIRCFWIGRQAPGEPYEPSAIAIVDGDKRAIALGPLPYAGLWCFRVVPITAVAQGIAAESCVAVSEPATRTVTSDGSPPTETALVPSPPRTGSSVPDDGAGVAAAFGVMASAAIAGLAGWATHQRWRPR
jgi:hypothetical protein